MTCQTSEWFAPSAIRTSRAIRLLIGSLLGAVLTATAQTTLDWNNSGTAFATGANWVGGVAPADSLTANIANFGTASPTFQPTLATSQSVAGVAFGSGAGSFTLSGAGTLTLGASGLNNAATANTQIITAPLALGTTASFTNSGLTGSIFVNGAVSTGGFGLTLDGGTGSGVAIVNGVISGSGGLTKTGTGQWRIQGVNTYTGGTTVNGGTLHVNNNGGVFGTLPTGENVTINGTVAGTTTIQVGSSATQNIGTLTFGGAGANASAANTLQINGGTFTLGGTVTFDATNNPSDGAINGAGTLDLGGNRTFNVANSTGTGSDLVISSVISGSGSLTKTGDGVLKLTSSGNTYTGDTIINGGTIFVSLNNNVLPTSGNVIINQTGAGTSELLLFFGETGRTQTIGALTLGGSGATGSSTLNQVTIPCQQHLPDHRIAHVGRLRRHGRHDFE